MSNRPEVGKPFPKMTVNKLGGGEVSLGTPDDGFDWQMVVVYRGKHCPICTRYLGELRDLLSEYHALGVEVVAVSGDSEAKATDQLADVAPNYPVGYDLTLDQMRTLGLYISHPRSAQETDAPFAEPGLFVINGDGDLQVADISNAPFARPPLSNFRQGLAFIKNPENNYPIRGTHD